MHFILVVIQYHVIQRHAEAFAKLEEAVAAELAKIEACDEEKRECKESFGESLTEYEEKRKSLDTVSFIRIPKTSFFFLFRAD